MNRSEQINELATALAKAQGAVKGALKDSTNPHFRSAYADLSSVWEACREALSANGIAVVQAPSSIEAGVCVETMLMHSSGQWCSETLSIPVQKADAQGFGSALTYCRRYGLASMVGVAPEDDDGNAAAQAKPVTGDFKPAAPKVPITPTAGTMAQLSVANQETVTRLANRIIDSFLAKDPDQGYANYLDAKTELEGDADSMAAMWSLLDSKMRSTLKQMHNVANLRTPSREAASQP